MRGSNGLGTVKKHGRSWWLDVRLHGVRRWIKLGPIKLFEKREAREIADARIKELLMPKSLEQKGRIPFSEFAKKYLSRMVETKRSWGKYAGEPVKRTPLVHPQRFFGDTPLKDITADRVEEFRSYLLARPVGKRRLKIASANRYLSLLRHALNCAVRWKDADSNPAAGVNLPKEAPLPSRILSESEQGKLLRVMPQWLRQITLFTLQTAMRRGDVLNLTWAAVQGETLELCETKEGEKRYVPLNVTARAILSTLLASRKPEPSGYVFEPEIDRQTLVWKIRRTWRHSIRKAGIPWVRFHDLRHTALTRLVQAGVDVRTVQAIAGHASLRTMQRYLHSSDEAKKAAVEKLDMIGRPDAELGFSVGTSTIQ